MAQYRRRRDGDLEWIDWFNDRRLLGRIGYIPPVEFEQAYYRQQESAVMSEAFN